jgi:hypothetical protein
MARAQGRYQPAALIGPQWRQEPLNGSGAAAGCAQAAQKSSFSASRVLIDLRTVRT